MAGLRTLDLRGLDVVAFPPVAQLPSLQARASAAAFTFCSCCPCLLHRPATTAMHQWTCAPAGLRWQTKDGTASDIASHTEPQCAHRGAGWLHETKRCCTLWVPRLQAAVCGGRCAAAQELSLQSCYIIGLQELPASLLQSNPALTSLALVNCELDRVPAFIARSSSLTALNLAGRLMLMCASSCNCTWDAT